MNLMNIVILAVVQGLAELLPVSSSAHVVVAEKLLGLDPSSPPMTLLLVMLHTGTMFAVIAYFWRTWRATYFRDAAAFRSVAKAVVAATAVTGVIGFGVIKLIEKTAFANVPHAEIEDLFSHLEIIAPALAAAGLLILIAGLLERRGSDGPRPDGRRSGDAHGDLRGGADPDLRQAGLIGAVQGLCLPFRGFSRSGATISAGMLLGLTKMSAETFSFALAVVLTPPVVAREAWRLVRAERLEGAASLGSTALMSAFGALIAFGAGLVALKWLSGWLERGRWYLFGIYCLAAAAAVFALHAAGY
jgi:undecaprenyl-diphosphatase